jgi:ribose transport system substrate-binding protein
MKVLNRRSVITLIAAAGAVAFSTGAWAAQKKIGMVLYDTSIPFFSNVITAAKKVADQNDVALDVQNGNRDLATQIAIVQQFITQEVDLILIAPGDPRGIVPAIRQANAANIPVMTINTKVDTSTGAKVATYIGVDDFVFGQKQGELLVKTVGENANVAYIVGQLGTSAQLDREAGLMDTLKKHPGIKIVARSAADWDNSKALAATQDFLSRFPKGSLDAIVDQGPEGVNGAKQARQNGRDDVKFIMGDYPADVRSAIMDGTVVGTINQDPTPQGKVAMENAIEWLDGKQSEVPQPYNYLDLPTVTKDNAETMPPAWGG